MNYCIINGKAYDVNVMEIEEGFEKLYTENTKRTIDNGTMFLDPIGTFISHSVKFAPLRKMDDFLGLWDFLKIPHREGFPVELADGRTTISYTAYTSSGARKMKRIVDGAPRWEEMTIKFIPIDAQVLP